MSDPGQKLNIKILKGIGILICVGIIIWQVIGLYQDNKQYQEANNEYQQLEQTAVKNETTAPATPEEDYPHLSINYTQLESINPDFVCWLYFPYFGINYPVVQETEIDEYLKKTFDGKRNSSGCLYTDIYSSPDFTGMHDIIFGHNMRNGSMFGKFKQLVQSEDTAKELSQNPYFYVYTGTTINKYEIFAYYVTTVGSPAYDVVTTDEQYDDFMNYIRSNNMYTQPTNVDLTAKPSILTLSTCSGRSGSGRRLVIHAAKIGSWEQE